jgi:hypothetical protein
VDFESFLGKDDGRKGGSDEWCDERGDAVLLWELLGAYSNIVVFLLSSTGIGSFRPEVGTGGARAAFSTVGTTRLCCRLVHALCGSLNFQRRSKCSHLYLVSSAKESCDRCSQYPTPSR